MLPRPYRRYDRSKITMDEFDNLDIYNGNPVHDMEVDYDYHINTGKLADEFGDTDLDDFINNLNDWD